MTTTQRQDGLLPCPFCGGEADYFASKESVFNTSWTGHVTHCTTCQARVQTTAGREKSAAMWNTRATPSSIKSAEGAGDLPLAVRLRDEEGPPLPQMVAQRRAQLSGATPAPDATRPEILDRVSKAWNITLTEPSESWDTQPPMDERYTQYVLNGAERAELRTALAAPVQIPEMGNTKAIGIERLIFKHVKVREIFDGALEFVGVSAAADAILAALAAPVPSPDGLRRNADRAHDRLYGFVPSPDGAGEFKTCPGCEMRRTCQDMKHCAGPSHAELKERFALSPVTGAADICPYCDAQMEGNACSICGRERVPPEGYAFPGNREKIEKIIEEQMLDAWNEICSDTDCHPLDIEQLGRRKLGFHSDHWSRLTAERSADAILSAQSSAGERDAAIEECAKIAERFKYSEETKATTNGARTYGNDGACDQIATAIRGLSRQPHPSDASPEGKRT